MIRCAAQGSAVSHKWLLEGIQELFDPLALLVLPRDLRARLGQLPREHVGSIGGCDVVRTRLSECVPRLGILV